MSNKSNNWNAPVSADVAARRAGGRRRYNAWRRDMAFLRRCEQVFPLLLKYGPWDRGTQARIARELNVSRATICRDVAALATISRELAVMLHNHCLLPRVHEEGR